MGKTMELKQVINRVKFRKRNIQGLSTRALQYLEAGEIRKNQHNALQEQLVRRKARKHRILDAKGRKYFKEERMTSYFICCFYVKSDED